MSTLTHYKRSLSLQFPASDFRYEPFAIGYTRPFFEPEVYSELVDSWPAQDLFAFMPNFGKKYSLSELNRPADYYAFLERTPAWMQVYREIKSPQFVREVLEFLKRSHIDLGIPADTEVNSSKKHWFSATGWAQKLLPNEAKGLKTRFEFSMLPADGGHVKPHTDSPGKIVTLVVSMSREGEWDQKWGGGTSVLRATKACDSFNYMNRQIEFSDTETIHTYPFEPNQCVTFIKTFNSLHGVSLLTGYGTSAMRKTITIVIEVA